VVPGAAVLEPELDDVDDGPLDSTARVHAADVSFDTAMIEDNALHMLGDSQRLTSPQASSHGVVGRSEAKHQADVIPQHDDDRAEELVATELAAARAREEALLRRLEARELERQRREEEEEEVWSAEIAARDAAQRRHREKSTTASIAAERAQAKHAQVAEDKARLAAALAAVREKVEAAQRSRAAPTQRPPVNGSARLLLPAGWWPLQRRQLRRPRIVAPEPPPANLVFFPVSASFAENAARATYYATPEDRAEIDAADAAAYARLRGTLVPPAPHSSPRRRSPPSSPTSRPGPLCATPLSPRTLCLH